MISRKQRGGVVLIGVVLLWAATVALSLFAVSQLRKIENELELLDIESTRLAETVARVDMLQLEITIMLRRSLGLLEYETTVPLPRLSKTPRNLDDYLEEQSRQIEILNGLVGEMTNLRRLEEWPALDELQSLVGRLAKQHGEYRKFIDEQLLPAVGGRVPTQVVAELTRQETELNDLVEQVSIGIKTLVQQSLAFSAEYKHTIYLEMVVVALLVIFGGLVLAVVIVRMQRRLMQTENLALVGKMAVTLRHEINNPLAAIVGNSYLLRHDEELTPKQRQETVVAIEESAQRISAVVKNLSEMEEVSITDRLGGVEMLDISKQGEAG